ncbi:MAG: Hsp20/alpha crystallin family protein [Acidobacteria bacterium]|nr:Hsp20/alpha crystallin family protein [Acidobacteriota bacterium]MCW5968459.1 Hsp20/alpha crystallin family protein [Blastocatellales bacterium]
MKRLLADLAAIERQLGELGGAQQMSAEQGPGTWAPAVDIFETETEFVLTAEVPGLGSDDIEIQVVERNLILRGERKWEREAHAEHFHRLESAYGKFERTFNLSEGIDIERISADLSDGVLRVALPKRASGSKQIEVKS